MNDSRQPEGIAGFFRATAGTVLANPSAFLLAALAWALANYFATSVWGADMMAVAADMSVADPEDTGAVFGLLGDLFGSAVLMASFNTAVFCAVLVLWVRSAALGTREALRGNFARRLMMAIWRTVSMYGYALLFVVGIGLLLLLVHLLGRLVLPAHGETILVVVAIVAAAVTMLPLTAAWLVAAVAAALDLGLNIRSAFRAISGKWLPLLLTILVLAGLNFLVSFAVNPNQFDPDAAQPLFLSGARLMAVSATGSLFTILLLGAGIVVLRRSGAMGAEESAQPIA